MHGKLWTAGVELAFLPGMCSCGQGCRKTAGWVALDRNGWHSEAGSWVRERGWGLPVEQYFDETLRVPDLPPTVAQRAVQSDPAELKRSASRPVPHSFSPLGASSVTYTPWRCLFLRNDSGDCWYSAGARAVELEDGLSNMSHVPAPCIP